MAFLVGVSNLPGTYVRRQSLFCTPKRGRFGGLLLRAKHFDEETFPFIESAVNAAALRFRETRQPEPLLVDPYADCFLTDELQKELKRELPHYCLASRYIDDELLRIVKLIDELTQVVLLTDGMDTRPYRLSWPMRVIIFDISPDQVFQHATEKLKDVGAKVPKKSLLFHIPWESNDKQRDLRASGFNGNRPSIWTMQGFPLMHLANFEEILSVVSSMAMKGSYFLGELPTWLAENEIGIKNWTDKIFSSYGFRVVVIDYNEVARNMGKTLELEKYDKILFVAEQLRFSDAQMERWRSEFQRIEDEGDEDGFEEL